MRPLIYSINVTLDGCVDHYALPVDKTLQQDALCSTHRHTTESLGRADALLFGRVTYQMMEEEWRLETRTVTMPECTDPFARTIDGMKKHVVSSTLDRVDWKAGLVRGDLAMTVQALKRESGKALFTGGVRLPMALAELGLIDEYEFIVQPIIVGRGPSLFAGLSQTIDLKLVDRIELSSVAVALRYEPRK